MMMAKISFDTRRMMHLDRRVHFTREQVNDGTLLLYYCPTKEMQADLLTKLLPRPAFEYYTITNGTYSSPFCDYQPS